MIAKFEGASSLVGLLDEAGDPHDVVLVGRLDRGGAVEVDLVGVDLEQRDDGGVALLLHLEHPLQQRVARVDDVVAEQHGERLAADVHLRAQHRVAETLAGRPGARSACRRGRSSS